ncbi:MAG: c-type cytochrome [Acidobacteriales bacterium]|nr:c-type cytochrome [Terriglobales bacterium]
MRLTRVVWMSVCVVTLAAVAIAGKKPSKPSSGDAAKGKTVFEQCSVCHNATSLEKKVGPGLKGLFRRSKLASGKPVNDENVMARINTGGEGMPPFKDILSDKERADLLAYLKTL